MMCRFAWAVALCGLIAETTSECQADQIFTFSFSGDGVSGSGSLDATANGDGTFTAISSTGTISAPNGVTDLDSLVTNPKAPSYAFVFYKLNNISTDFSYDDQLFPGQPRLDGYGLLWSSNSIYANVYYDSGTSSYYYLDSYTNLNRGLGIALSFTLNTVPEPSSLVLAGTAGAMGLAFTWRRRRKSIATSA